MAIIPPTSAPNIATVEAKIAVFDPNRGWHGGLRGRLYREDEDKPEHQEPFAFHKIFLARKAFESSLKSSKKEVILKDEFGHIYYSFTGADPEELEMPQPYRVRIPALPKVGSLRNLEALRTDLLTTDKLDGIRTQEEFCARAIAQSIIRHIEGIPETISDPAHYL